MNLGNIVLLAMKNQAIMQEILTRASMLGQLMYRSIQDVVIYFTHMIVG